MKKTLKIIILAFLSVFPVTELLERAEKLDEPSEEKTA
jgi:hypothetical protein